MLKPTTRRRFLQYSAALASAASLSSWISAQDASPSGFDFYVFDNGLNGPDVKTWDEKLALAAKIGFTGIEFHLLPQLPEMIAAADKHKIEIVGMYLTPNIEDELDPKLADAIKLLKGRRTRIELGLRSKTIKPSDPGGDEKGVAMVNRVSDLCADSGPTVSIYPHKGFWTQKVGDGLRVVKKSGRANVGTYFNLVHWKWTEPETPYETLLTEALPHLKAVTICGLKGEKGQTIVPLDQSDIDLVAFMKTVKKVGYRGQVGLQCYSIKGPSEAHLSGSMKRWKEILVQCA